MTMKKRTPKAMTAHMRLSSQILLRRRSPSESEKSSRRTKPEEPGEDEGEGGSDDHDEKKTRRTPNTCLPQRQGNQRSIGAPSKDRKRKPSHRSTNQNLLSELTCRGVPRAQANACTQNRASDGRNLTSVRVGDLGIPANALPGKHRSCGHSKTEQHCEHEHAGSTTHHQSSI